MKKDKEVDEEDLKEAEIDLMKKPLDLIILCRIREESSGKVVVILEIEVVLIEVLMEEEDFTEPISNEVKKDI